MREAISVIILAAGQSSRMRQDKALLVWQGQPMWKKQLELARALGSDDILISHPELGQADHKPGFGPLSGLHTLLPQCQHEKVLVLPIDMPLLSPVLLQPLLQAGGSAFFKNCALPCVLKHNPSVHAYIASQLHERGQRSVQALLEHCEAQPITCPVPDFLVNANTPEQWQALITTPFVKEAI